MEGTLGAYQIVWTSELLRFQTTDLSTQTSWKFRWLWDNVSDFREPFSSMFRGKSSNFRVSRFWPPMEIQYYVNLGFVWGCWMLGKTMHGNYLTQLWRQLRNAANEWACIANETRSASVFLERFAVTKPISMGWTQHTGLPNRWCAQGILNLLHGNALLGLLILPAHSGEMNCQKLNRMSSICMECFLDNSKIHSNMGWIRMDSDGLCMFIIYNFHIWCVWK